MDIVGRDQPDQELTIEFDRERCVWKFKKAETELWKQPPNPLLEAINNFLTEDKPEWEGTATELAEPAAGYTDTGKCLVQKAECSLTASCSTIMEFFMITSGGMKGKLF